MLSGLRWCVFYSILGLEYATVKEQELPAFSRGDPLAGRGVRITELAKTLAFCTVSSVVLSPSAAPDWLQNKALILCVGNQDLLSLTHQHVSFSP